MRLEFLGNKQPEGFRGLQGDPEKIQHDFYRRTLTNMTTKSLNITSMVVRTRYGSATVVNQDKDQGREDFGAVVKVDIERSPPVPKNMLAPGQSYRTTHFITGGSRSLQALEATLGVEQDGRQSEVTYQLIYKKN